LLNKVTEENLFNLSFLENIIYTSNLNYIGSKNISAFCLSNNSILQNSTYLKTLSNFLKENNCNLFVTNVNKLDEISLFKQFKIMISGKIFNDLTGVELLLMYDKNSQISEKNDN